MSKHIGIAAVSPEGAALCFRDIFRYASSILGDRGHPTVSLHNEPFEHYLAAVMRDDWHAVGELLIRSAHALARSGAEFCITPDNLMQHAIQFAATKSPIPWLTMTDLVSDAVVADGRKTVGLIGTKLVMLGSTYQTFLGLRGVKVIAPTAEDADAIDAVIFRELIHGTVVESSRKLVLASMQRLMDRGAEGVILGCSEAPLLITRDLSPIPIYDATALLAEGAVRMSLGQQVRAGA